MEQRRSASESLRNIGLWLFILAVGISFIVLGFQGRVGSGLAAFFAPSTLAPMNEDGTAQPAPTDPGKVASTAASAAPTLVQTATQNVATNAAIGIVNALQSLKDLPSVVAQLIGAEITNPKATNQAASTGFWQGVLAALGL